MFTMVMEFSHKTDALVVVSPEERAWFKANLDPPRKWKIWIGNYDRGKWEGIWSHTTVPILPAEEKWPDHSDLDICPPNTQSSTIIAGKLFIQILSSEIAAMVRRQSINGEMLPIIWPYKRSPLSWPPPLTVTDADAEAIALALATRAKNTPPATRR